MRRLKKRFSAIMSLISEGRRNTRRLCSIAGVSPKCYYAHAKGPSGKEMSDERLIAIIRDLQETYGNSLGYRKMPDRIKDDYGIVLGRKKVLRLMGCVFAIGNQQKYQKNSALFPKPQFIFFSTI